nr:MAG TPA: hypothetical protein [Caudoviricetes sp.]
MGIYNARWQGSEVDMAKKQNKNFKIFGVFLGI